MRFRQWLRRRERFLDWMTAWFGGSAVTAFQLHNPGGLGWLYAVLAGVSFGAGITAHCIEERPS